MGGRGGSALQAVCCGEGGVRTTGCLLWGGEGVDFEIIIGLGDRRENDEFAKRIATPTRPLMQK